MYVRMHVDVLCGKEAVELRSCLARARLVQCGIQSVRFLVQQCYLQATAERAGCPVSRVDLLNGVMSLHSTRCLGGKGKKEASAELPLLVRG